MARALSKFTYADLREMPEDGRRYEVVGGDLLASPSPKVSHQVVVGAVYALLREAARAGHGRALVAPTDVFFDEHNAVVPDALFVSKAHLAIIAEDAVRGVPDLIVEVLSPSTRARDLGPKLRLYERAGVRVYWVLDPAAQTLALYSRSAAGPEYEEPRVLHGAATVECPLFPGIASPVAALFAD